MDNNMYQQPNFESEQPMSLGEWIITLILTAIPCVGLIMLLVWAFGGTTQTTKKNFARAQLIFTLIAIVVVVVLYAIIGVTALSALSSNY